MSGDANKSLNERWVDAFNARDWASEAASRAADYMAHMSGSPAPLDATGWDACHGEFLRGLPRCTHRYCRCGRRCAQGSKPLGAAWHAWQATFNGIPPTGRQVTFAGVDFSHIVDGKVAEHWAQFDLLALMQQLGAAPTAN